MNIMKERSQEDPKITVMLKVKSWNRLEDMRRRDVAEAAYGF